jgi:predicted ribosome quality control (RQC) complex YloA/Tae2 family protein
MSFDSLVLRSVVSELHETILGGEVLSVIQSSPYEFILRVSSNGKGYNLFFSIHPVYARVHLTDSYPDKDKRWHFSDFLQTHLRKGIISAIEQVDLDRIIRLQINPPQDIIDPAPKILIGEFMGKHSNVVLIDSETNKILEALKHVDDNMSRFRQILPGETYHPPPVTQPLDFFSVDTDTLTQLLAPDNEPVWKKLLKNIQGMSPALAKEISARSDNRSLDSVVKAFQQIRDDIVNSKYSPNVLVNEMDEVADVSAIELQQFSGLKRIQFHSISQALEYYYERQITRESFITEKNSLVLSVKKRISELDEKQETLDEQMRIAEEAETLRMKGDMLIANLNKLKRGQKEAVLTNTYDPDGLEITIQLDEKLSPSDNAQRYFQNYKKAKKSKDVVTKFSNKNKAELKHLSEIAQRIEQTDDLDILSNIRTELAKRGIVKEKITNTRKPKVEVSLFKRFRSSEDFLIYIGRNDKENDLLVKQESSPSDMWLHAKQIEGSHVLIRNPEKKSDIPRKTLLEAAVLAASFSKAKHSGIVPVDYTWVRYVRKPKGAKPGFVTYINEKTLFVSPSNSYEAKKS